MDQEERQTIEKRQKFVEIAKSKNTDTMNAIVDVAQNIRDREEELTNGFEYPLSFFSASQRRTIQEHSENHSQHRANYLKKPLTDHANRALESLEDIEKVYHQIEWLKPYLVFINHQHKHSKLTPEDRLSFLVACKAEKKYCSGLIKAEKDLRKAERKFRESNNTLIGALSKKLESLFEEYDKHFKVCINHPTSINRRDFCVCVNKIRKLLQYPEQATQRI